MVESERGHPCSLTQETSVALCVPFGSLKTARPSWPGPRPCCPFDVDRESHALAWAEETVGTPFLYFIRRWLTLRPATTPCRTVPPSCFGDSAFCYAILKPFGECSPRRADCLDDETGREVRGALSGTRSRRPNYGSRTALWIALAHPRRCLPLLVSDPARSRSQRESSPYRKSGSNNSLRSGCQCLWDSAWRRPSPGDTSELEPRAAGGSLGTPRTFETGRNPSPRRSRGDHGVVARQGRGTS